MTSPTASTKAPGRLYLIGHAILLGVLSIFVVLAAASSREAGAASPQPGIGVLRNGDAYPTGSGYDRYSYIIVGLKDGAAAGALPITSLQYMSGPAVQPRCGIL